MARPKHRRCQVCNVVTARYVRTVQAGGVTMRIWSTDCRSGEVTTVNGTVIRCNAHAEA
jgi:hypothetical protein